MLRRLGVSYILRITRNVCLQSVPNFRVLESFGRHRGPSSVAYTTRSTPIKARLLKKVSSARKNQYHYGLIGTVLMYAVPFTDKY